MFSYDLPPSLPTSPAAQETLLFRPGELSQDVYTLPVEISLIGAINHSYTPRSNTLFPIFQELTGEKTKRTTYSGKLLFPLAVGIGSSIFTGLVFSNPDFHLGLQFRGFLHSILLTELAASTAKTIFQKPRPDYDQELASYDRVPTDNARASFYSGHATHVFNFATYTSLMMFQFSSNEFLNIFYSFVSFAGASLVSYSRIPDHAHNPSDVLVGALAGTIIGSSVFFRVQDVDHEIKAQKIASQESEIHWNFLPNFSYDDENHPWYGAQLQLDF